MDAPGKRQQTQPQKDQALGVAGDKAIRKRAGGQSRQTEWQRAEPSFVAGWAGARPAESPQTRVGSKQGEPRPKDLWAAVVEALIRLSPGHRAADTDSRL